MTHVSDRVMNSGGKQCYMRILKCNYSLAGHQKNWSNLKSTVKAFSQNKVLLVFFCTTSIQLVFTK